MKVNNPEATNADETQNRVLHFHTLAQGRFMDRLAKANGVPLSLADACPLIHGATGKPLRRDIYHVTEAGLLLNRVVSPRHCSIDHLTLHLPQAQVRSDGIRRLEQQGFQVRDHWRHGSLDLRYGPLFMRIRGSWKGNLLDQARRPGRLYWTLNPAWMADYGTLLNLARTLFTKADPDTTEVVEIHIAADWGLGGAFFTAMQAGDNKVNAETYATDHGALRGRVNGIRSGSQGDLWVLYDKAAELAFRKPHVRAALIDVAWWRTERRLSGRHRPVRLLRDLPDLAAFHPFKSRRHRLATVHLEKIDKFKAHWLTLAVTLGRFKTISEREGQAQAVRDLNIQGHFRRYVKAGYITLQDVMVDPDLDWATYIEGFFTPGGGHLPAEEDYDFYPPAEGGFH